MKNLFEPVLLYNKNQKSNNNEGKFVILAVGTVFAYKYVKQLVFYEEVYL